MPHPQTRLYTTHVMTPRDYAPSGYLPAAFKEAVNSPSTYETGYLTAWEADRMLGRAAAKGLTISVHEYGALVIAPRSDRSRTLEIVVHPKRLTARQYENLEFIDCNEHHARIERDEQGFVTGIDAGPFIRIPRTQTGILLDRGWLSRRPHSDDVWISAAGRMAMAHRWHAGQGLSWRLLKGLYLDAALTAAARART